MKKNEQTAAVTIKRSRTEKAQTSLMRQLLLALAILSFSALLTHVVAQDAKPPTAPQSTEQAAQPQEKRATFFTPAIKDEYVALVKSNPGKAAVQAWARKHKFEIVSLKGYDILVIPEQGPQNPTDQEASNCDHTKCPKATGAYGVTNTKNLPLGFQAIECTAGSCKFVKDSNGRWQRHCGDWKCKDVGRLIQ